MKKLGKIIVRFKFIVIALFLILFSISLGLSSYVKTNDDIMSYLPSDIESIEGTEIIKESFNTDRTLYVLIQDVDLQTANKIVNEILDIEINDDKAVSSMEFYQTSKENDNTHLYVLVVADEINTEEVYDLAASISSVLENNDTKGGAVSGTETLISDLNMTITLIVTIIVISLVIILFTKSYFDVVIILGSVGVAIVINTGTNILFGNGISGITKSAASLIQLAVSVDYSLFIVNNFREQRKNGLEVDKAIPIAVKASAKSVLAGSITTIAGFLALMFMEFELGRELGLVLAKGIIISLVVSLTLVPALIKLTYKISEKFEHKEFLPKFGFIVKGRKKATSIGLTILLVLIAIVSFASKSDMDYIYGEPPIGEVPVYVKENFDVDNSIVFIYDESEVVNKMKFLSDISKLEGSGNGEINQVITKEIATNVAIDENLEDTKNLLVACSFGIDSLPDDTKVLCDTLPKLTDPNQAEGAAIAIITQEVTDQFVSDGYELILISLNDPNNEKENEFIFNTIEEIRDFSNVSFEKETYLAGVSVSFYDMKEILVIDDKVVSIVSIIAVGFVIIIAFKSISIPLLLLLGIQSAIWLNLALSSLLGGELLMFMGVVMVSSMQLGASIDYSILLTEKYEYNRFKKGQSVKDAILNAVENSSHSILTSALALTISGLLMSIMQDGSLGQIGLLLGRGAFLSLIISLFIFPHVLILTDKFIKKGTIGLNHK